MDRAGDRAVRSRLFGVLCLPVGTIKRHIAGKGNADKAAVIAAVRKLGFAPGDDNEADALALLDWAIAQGIGGAR